VAERGAPSRIAAAVLPGALALLVLALVLSPITNNDLFLHLRTGALILASGRVPHVDDYSALARGRPFTAHEWLAGVLFRLVQLLGGPHGFEALVLFKGLVALLVVGALLAAARRLGAPPETAVACAVPVMILAAARFLDRPHILSYLMAALVLWLLAGRRAGRGTPLWPLLPLQIAWANLHGAFLLGPLLVGLAGAGEGLEGLALGLAPPPHPPRRQQEARSRLLESGRLVAMALLLIAASAINPYGWHLLAFPFRLTGSVFMEQIYEWQPPFHSAFLQTYMMRFYVVWGLFGIGVLAAAWIRALRRRSAPPGGLFPTLLFAVLLGLSLRMNRNVTDFALATLPGVAASAAWIGLRPPPGRPRRLLRGSLVAALLLLAALYVTRGYPYSPGSRRPFGLGLGDTIPVAGADYLQANGIRGNAFNTYSYGAYLVYRFYPEVRVAMDSRNDVYGEQLYAGYVRALTDPAALGALLHRLDASLIFIEWASQGAALTAQAIHRLGGWSLVYFDDTTAIYLRDDGPYGTVVRRDRYAVIDPALFNPGSPPADAERALGEAQRAAGAPGGGWMARVMAVQALLALGRPADAARRETALVRETPPAHIEAGLGLIHLARGENALAAARFRAALRINPRMNLAHEGLRRALASP
jgi:hypothetical protein